MPDRDQPNLLINQPDQAIARQQEPVASATSSQGAWPTGRDVLVQPVLSIERSVKERRDVDVPLVNWWLAFLLIVPVTLGIYLFVMYFQRIGRVDKFILRKQQYYRAIIDYTSKQADQKGRLDAERHRISDLNDEIDSAFSKLKPINAGLSFLLTLVTIGIYGFYVLYRMNRAWYQLQVIEQDFDDKISQIWSSLGLLRYPINFRIDSSKNRSYVLYLVLSFLTIFIWAAVWDYKIHTDPDKLYGEFHSVEDTVLQTVRNS